MPTMTRFHTWLACLILIGATCAHGQTFEGVLDESSASYSVDISFDLIASTFATIKADPLPNFDTAYSALGDTTFSVTWSAPAGQRIEIAPPEGFPILDVQFIFGFGSNTFVSGSVSPSLTVTSNDFVASNGVLPTFNTNAGLTGPGGDSVSAVLFVNGLVTGETYSFSSLTGEFVVPAGYDVDFDSPFSRFDLTGSGFFITLDTSATPPADPGEWIRLVPIPEPASLALLGLGGLLVTRRRRCVSSNPGQPDPHPYKRGENQ